MGITKGATNMLVRVLGGIEAGGESSHGLGGPTQRRVFAALVARRNEAVSVGELVEICWPDDDAPDRAEHNVRTYVHRLRTALCEDGDRIETASGGYRLRLKPSEFDIGRFDESASAATRLLHTGDITEALDRIDQAEELWRGRPYAEFAGESWAMPEVARLTELRWSMHERRAEAQLTAGRPGEAVASLESMIVDEPLRERPRALLMRALYESGRQVEALRAFQEFRRLLVDEVGVEPSSVLVELDRAIASGGLEASAAKTRTVGNYELHERIGEGAFAVVHRATQASLGREVAVKVVRAELANRPEFIRRFEAEAQMVAAIEHPNVVSLYDYWREPGQAFLVMRWMSGGSLETRLDDGPWSLDDTVELVDQIADALSASHEHGVVHRDVKPGNILFDETGRAYLGDFGIALTADERSRPEAALSEGSPLFASPEQLRREPAGPETDVHALGIIAYTLLTGRTPFADAPDEPTLLHRQLHEPIPPARAHRPELPERVDEVLAVAASKRADDRYPTAPAFAAAFRAAASSKDQLEPITIELRPRANPYKGLRAFDETDVADFHGRERLVDELIDHLAEPDTRMLAVVGPSGSGKSSVVRAGVVPALRGDRIPDSSSWFVTTMIPGGHPFEALETALLRVAVNPPASLLDQLRDGDRGVLRAVKRVLPADDGIVAIVIDQFEELFTSAVADADRDQFLRALAVAATEPASPFRLLFTLRADFYDRPLQHPEFAPLLKRHAVAVTPLAPDELEHAIVTPAAAVGVRFEPGLVAEIIADVNHEPGALPLLQYALTQAFDLVDGDTITIEHYRSTGGIAGALGRQAEDFWQAAVPAEQQAARRLFGRLVVLGEGTEDTRRRVQLAELGDDPATEAATGLYGSARLLTFDRDPATREPTVEIAHEALIREWQRLGDWLDDDRDTLRIHRHLTVAAAGWADRDRDANELYRGARLDATAPLLTTETVALNDTEADFLNASVRQRDQEAEEEQQRLGRLHRLVAATAVVAAIALIAGVVALMQWRRADDQAEAIDLDNVRSSAFDVSERNPGLAVLLAAEAYRMDGSTESADVVQRVVSGLGGLGGSIPGVYLDLELVDDGRTAIARTYRDVEVWDLERREFVRALDRPTQIFTGMAVSESGGVVALFDDAGLDLIDLATGAILSSHERPVDAAFSPLGDELAVSTGTALQFWDVSSPREPTVADEVPAEVEHVAWDRSGGGYIVVMMDRSVEYWERGGESPVWTQPPVSENLSNFAVTSTSLFDSTDETVVLATDEGRGLLIRAHDLADGELVGGPVVASGGLVDLEWMDESALTVTGTLDTSGTRAFDLITDTRIEPEIDVPTARAFEYSPLLDRTVEAGALGLRIWHPTGANPFERVLPLSTEQRELWSNAVNMSVVLVDDSTRAVVSGFSIPSSPVIEYDLTTDPPIARSTGLHGIVLGANGHPLLINEEEVVMLDDDLHPVGQPIPTPAISRGPTTSPDGRFFALRMAAGGVNLYASSGDLVAEIRGAGARAGPVSFSSDGAFLVVHELGGENLWGVFDTSTGQQLADDDANAFILPIGSGETLYALPDVGDFRILQLDPATKEAIGPPLVGQTSSMAWVVESTAGTLTATSGYDGTVQVWDRSTGKQVGREVEGFRDFQFSDDGAVLAVLHDEHVSVWNFDTSTWVDTACEIAGRNLTRVEWEEFGPRTISYRATCPEYPIES